MSVEHFDVLIVGAGLAGVGAAHHLQRRFPTRRYAILEGRDDLGGTWSLFRYPGVRSDSDMFTLGYSFRPWKAARTLADGPAILEYLRDTARASGIDRHVRYRHRVRSASWSSEHARWTVEVEVGEANEPARLTCNFLVLCSGYYRYDAGYEPDFPGREDFRGRVVHPQHWPEGLDVRGRRVVVIGSGATAVTLVPALAGTAAHVTMLQRSPSYILSVPTEDRLARWVRRALPERVAHGLLRGKYALVSLGFYRFCRRSPGWARRYLLGRVARELPPDVGLDPHFAPRYRPWDERLCLVPDGDLFRALRDGLASVVTDEVERFTPDGIRLRSGRELPAEVIVTATGLRLLALGGIRLDVDGTAVDPSRCVAYRGVMLGNVPNLAICAGYTNASWTLRAELAAQFVCRILRHMDRHGYARCEPRCDPGTVQPRPLVPLTSGYIRRGIDMLPKQGARAPWTVRQNYPLDLLDLRLARLEDGVLAFERARPAAGRGG
jgi:cation diffusion facilitator CzcD-associated flavoprotein CzcO